jgi:hypothetical protein
LKKTKTTKFSPQKIVVKEIILTISVSDLRSQLKKCMGVWIDRIKTKILLIIFL